MNLNKLKRFAQDLRKKLISQIARRLDYVLKHDDEYLRDHVQEKKTIQERYEKFGKDQLLEEVAYIWFNRITALRFMDNNSYNPIRIVSPLEGETQPQILSEVKQGKIPDELSSVKNRILDYLNREIETNQPEQEAYKIILLTYCNKLGNVMPFLFEKIQDWAALLLPVDLLSSQSIISDFQENILPEDCKNVEIIGWLYQFYISEKKDQVFADLRKNKKISQENIPAATQLFTPHWIVRYMVENSLGRLWLNNKSKSNLKKQMDYFVETDPESTFIKIKNPETLKILDPACGSGHILVYAFDLLYTIYEEEGYSPSEIPSLIVQNNLYGIDIDNRAASLAGFALLMKAREKDRFFFDKKIIPNVIAMKDIDVNLKTAKISLSPALMESFFYLKQAKNIGSLIPVDFSTGEEIKELQEQLVDSKTDLFESKEIELIQNGLNQLSYLLPKYHCVITNPPYMGGKGMNERLKDFVKKYYKDSKSDLFAVFMERIMDFALKNGTSGIMTPFTWMFLHSYEKLRLKIINEYMLYSLVRPSYTAFFQSAIVPICAFIINKTHNEYFKGFFFDLGYLGNAEEQPKRFLEAKSNPTSKKSFRAVISDFKKIPGSPIAYWVSTGIKRLFENEKNIAQFSEFTGSQNITANNELYLRYIFEVATVKIGKGKKWILYSKGGQYRKWYGNLEYIIDWSDNSRRYYKNNKTSNLLDKKYWFKKGIAYTDVTSYFFSCRYMSSDFVYDKAGPMFHPTKNAPIILGILNSKISRYIFKILNSTFHFQVRDVKIFPILIPKEKYHIDKKIFYNISLSKSDWDLRETSWDFLRSPLLTDYIAQPIETAIDENLTDISLPSTFKQTASIEKSYISLTSFWTEQFKTLHKNEEELNRIFIDLYELNEELTPDVPYNEITILQQELESNALKENQLVFKKDEIIRQFISYAVGCIFGRYSLDKDDLILANSGEEFKDYLKQIPNPSFMPDEDAILPLTEEDDFTDDLPNQFRRFVKTAFGEVEYQNNIRFIEQAIKKDMRSYLIKDFYNDHIKRYKKRPIYWMITSPSGSLKALIYLHRYNKDTINRFLNDYLRPFQKKTQAKLEQLNNIVIMESVSKQEQTKAQKRILILEKVRKELQDWEREVVLPVASKRIVLDLDDGVKINYGKLGKILETVKGLNK